MRGCAPPTISSRAPKPTTAASRSCRCRKPARDISLRDAAAPRACGCASSSRSRTRVERNEALPAIARFVAATPTIEVVWLSDGVDLGAGRGIRRRARQVLAGQAVTVIEGGIAPAHALAAADNAAGALTVKVLRANRARRGHRRRARARSQRLAARRGALHLQGQRARNRSRRSTCRSRSATTSRGSKSRRALGRRRATARQALAAAHHRRDLRRDRRYRAAAARLDLSICRARSTRSPTCGWPSAARRRKRCARFLEQNVPMLILADVGNVAGAGARAARRNGSRTAACWCALPARGLPRPTTISCR